MATSTIKQPNEIIDITDYCYFNPNLSFKTTEPYGGRLYYNKTCNYVFGNIHIEPIGNNSLSTSVVNQEFLVGLRDEKNNHLIPKRSAVCGLGTAVFGSDETSFTIQPRIDTDGNIISSHSQGASANLPKYTIFAFLG